MHDDKIFGVGLGRTGTKSLTAALEILGYRCLHWAPDKATAAEVLTGAKVSRIAEHRDAIIDTILPLLHYQEYAQRFPNAKFILTTREVATWLPSMRRHMIHMRSPDSRNYSAHLYGSLLLNRWATGSIGDQRLSDAFVTHNGNVRVFFADMPDRFLELDISSGEGWDKLCPFLGVGIPDVPFPNERKPPNRLEVYNTCLPRDRLALVTMILPRMELDHLQEWVWWHYVHGVRHIWVICDRPDIFDAELDQSGGRCWNKKPWANFNVHLSDEQTRAKIDEIAACCELRMPYLNVRVLDISDFSHQPIEYIEHRQLLVADKVSAMAEGLADWVGFIDVDELLFEDVIDRLSFLGTTQPEINTVRMMRQCLMENRFQNGKAIKYSDITNSWGVIPDDSYIFRGNGKSFVRPGRGKWVSPHRAQSTREGVDIKSIDIRFYHFRGVEATEKTLEVGWDRIYQWAKDNAKRQRWCDHVAVLKRL